ncbi:GlxA family transcriptional regulator [Paraurantiacibacter namhicola]|uniref:HTH-type transcriptional regulator CdhR n=1 Tax=Paraurantiacibacter namhicola TaxID=645517 RepID=A0A1C7D4S5_9SPHN|nr:GlxA family transcriptional regulator [Paraurantiacibacter namhicola]ANU06460.1 HTH-type transcriptional regulator CdhR [Paraurantiacibacter namhicola]
MRRPALSVYSACDNKCYKCDIIDALSECGEETGMGEFTGGENGVPAAPTRKFTFLLVPEFSMMAFTAAIEPLRAANRTAGRTLYSWRVATLDGGQVKASNGVSVVADGSLADVAKGGVLLVCAGLSAADHASPALLNALRLQARHTESLGGVCTGSIILAEAGLLGGYRCTVHWEDLVSFAENFPELEITSRLYEIDRDRVTCSGGTAPLDMMIHFIALDHGRELAVGVAELMVHHFAREAHEPQRLSILERTGVRHPKLLQAIALMEEAIEHPAPLDRIAEGAGLSPRQMERLFAMHFEKTPSRYYLGLRLARARHLLGHTALPVVQVALATGFASPAHFTKCYREAFGNTPSAERQAPVKDRLPIDDRVA